MSVSINSGKNEREWDKYFNLWLDYKNDDRFKGKKFVLLYEIGDFFEIYGVDNGVEFIGDIRNACEAMGLNVGQKNREGFNDNNDPLKNNRDHPLFGGYKPLYRSMYEPLLLQAGYYIILWRQTGNEITVNGKKMKERAFDKIITPATYIEDDTGLENNCFVSIFIENLKPKKDKMWKWEQGMYTIGMTSINLATNQTIIYEAHSRPEENMYSINELYRFLQSQNPLELMIKVGHTIDLEQKLENITFEDFLRKELCLYNFTTVHSIENIDQKFIQPKYQEEFLKKVYQKKSKMTNVFNWLDIEMKRDSTLSLIQLLDFVYIHDPRLLNKLNKPETWTNEKYLTLSNNAIEQLHIYTPGSKNPSLFDLLNKTTTVMGKRLLQYYITSPSIDIQELNKRWYFVDVFKADHRFEDISKMLKGVVDLQKYYRLIQLSRISPNSLLRMHKSHVLIYKLFEHLLKSDWVDDSKLFDNAIVSELNSIIKYFNKYFDSKQIERCNNEMKISLFKTGIYPQIDKLQEDIDKTKCSLAHFKEKVAEWIGLEKALKVFNVKKGTDIIHNKNRPISFKLSVNRFELIDHYINEIDSGKERIFKYKSFKDFGNRNKYNDDEGDDGNEHLTDDVILTDEDIMIIKSIYKISRPGKSSTAKDVSFQSKIVSESSTERYTLEEKMEKLCKEKFDHHIIEMDNNFENLMENLPFLVSFIDVMTSNAKCASKYAYNKPEIFDDIEEDDTYGSFIQASDVRNPIIERINTQIPYIPNDVDIGNEDSKGLLLFGLNDCGKSSYMRSVGLNLVMAQMGGFVAAKTFEFYPFRNILTRLSGQDNVYKGEGSFRVEMNEFRDISGGCDKFSLILGDELCRGTTYYDAISIVTSGIQYMVEKNTNYIFTTHLHQLPELEEIQAIDSLQIKHLQVKRDPITNVITYLRKLVDGPGDSFYGIEVARGCGVPEEILRNAEKIRKKLIGMSSSVLDTKKSNFNANFFKRECDVCGKPSDETHHIREQNEANEDGIIEFFHKNAEHNLVWVCIDCHHKETHRDKNIEFVGYFMTSEGKQLVINRNDHQDDKKRPRDDNVKEKNKKKIKI